MVDDAAKDAGLQAPSYADIRSVRLFEVGKDLRVEVRMDGQLPIRLGDAEVMGLGVDLYEGNQETESSYQLFADGTAEGWVAYLQTPSGFVAFPGRLFVRDSSIVFEVPWVSLGSIRGVGFRVFCDWTESGAVLAADGNDAAPNSGRATFAR